MVDRLQSLEIDHEEKKVSRGYSQFVKSMRWVLPIIALAMFAVVLAWPKLDNAIKVVEEDDIPSLADAKQAINELINPRYETTDSQNNPVLIRANRALQSRNNLDLVRLESPAADLKTKKGEALNIAADQGTYDQKNEKLFLQDNIMIKHASEYQMDAMELRVNLKTQEAFSDKTVKITGPDADLEAQGLEGTMNNGTLSFKGPATLTLYPQKQEEKQVIQ